MPPKARPETVDVADIPTMEFSTAPESLVSSIRLRGIMEPVVLADRGDKGYEVIEGVRRVIAAKQLGIEKVPAHVYDYEDVKHDLYVLSSELNNKRKPNHVADYLAVAHMAITGKTDKEIAKATGITTPTVRRLREISGIHGKLRSGFVTGRIKFSVVKLICKASGDDQRRLAEELDGPITAQDVRKYCPSAFKPPQGELFEDEIQEWRALTKEAIQAALDRAPASVVGSFEFKKISRAIEIL
jgi:ParB/RepB/Spo0J family partition protein